MVDDQSIDLVILDPNYQDWDKLCRDGLICQSVRVLKETGNIICFTKQPFDFNLRNEVNHIFRRKISWTFSNGGAWVSKKLPLVSHQDIYWLCVDKKKHYINVRTGLSYNESTKSVKRKNKVFGDYNEEGKEFVKSEEGTWIRDHYHFNKPHSGKIPAKPKELMRILIHCLCPENGVILDPFLGSGTTIDVMGQRTVIGWENDINLIGSLESKVAGAFSFL